MLALFHGFGPESNNQLLRDNITLVVPGDIDFDQIWTYFNQYKPISYHFSLFPEDKDSTIPSPPLSLNPPFFHL